MDQDQCTLKIDIEKNLHMEHPNVQTPTSAALPQKKLLFGHESNSRRTNVHPS